MAKKQPPQSLYRLTVEEKKRLLLYGKKNGLKDETNSLRLLIAKECPEVEQ